MCAAQRRLPVGAELQARGGAHFRVWSPDHDHLSVVVQRRGNGPSIEIPLEPERGGYASARFDAAKAGDLYRYRVNGDLLPDPASRFQPEGPSGPSEIIDPDTFAWTDRAWKGLPLRGAVFYEMHCGTFTHHGTWIAAMSQLPGLVDLGITHVEVMPVADFAGRFGWGYDGVFPYAPFHKYGRPDEFKAFINRAHELGLAVLLDVVYNHLGPSGCVFKNYAQSYFTTRKPCEWGEPLNFDGEQSGPVREYFISNAAYWIAEYHLDGLRIDATQCIYDDSKPHVLEEITRAVKRAAGRRTTLLISENEPQQTRMVRPPGAGGYGLDALWNDDFHHSAIVALTGRNEAYYGDHQGTPQEFISAAKRGFLFQGQRYAWQKQPRGTATDGIPPEAFVLFIENHDQLANTGDGSRMHRRTSPGKFRAMTALFLLLPGTPMLFQGQEMASSSPFLYFADHEGDLAKAVLKGRSEFLGQFPSIATPEMREQMALPQDLSTFDRCKLDWHDRERHPKALALHRDLIRLRRSDAAFSAQRPGAVDGAVLGPEAFVLRFAAPRPEDARLLIVNLGRDLTAASFAEPLLAPPENMAWHVRWSSEHPMYGGMGTPPVVGDHGWRIPGPAAVVLAPEAMNGGSPKRG